MPDILIQYYNNQTYSNTLLYILMQYYNSPIHLKTLTDFLMPYSDYHRHYYTSTDNPIPYYKSSYYYQQFQSQTSTDNLQLYYTHNKHLHHCNYSYNSSSTDNLKQPILMMLDCKTSSDNLKLYYPYPRLYCYLTDNLLPYSYYLSMIHLSLTTYSDPRHIQNLSLHFQHYYLSFLISHSLP